MQYVHQCEVGDMIGVLTTLLGVWVYILHGFSGSYGIGILIGLVQMTASPKDLLVYSSLPFAEISETRG